MDRTLVGIPASPGIVVGPVHLLLWEVPDVRHRYIAPDGVEAEVATFLQTLDRALERLRYVRNRVERHVGTEEARIFEAQTFILQDSELIGRVEALIREHHFAAESAFDLTMHDLRHDFSHSHSAMVRERVGDLVDVHIRVLSLLLGLPDHDPVDVPKGTNAILVTQDLTPSLTVQLDREAICAIATDSGTSISHVAILARSLNLPAVVGLRDATSQLKGGERVILDGTAGTLVINPAGEDIERYRARGRRQEAVEAEDALVALEEAITTDGVRLTLRANVDLPEDAEHAATSGADGVGLMRTEFLVVGRTTMPTEDEQYRAYRRVLQCFSGHTVVIRTFDIGGDKLPVGGYPTEANPFLGWRAIRMCLDEPVVFKTQLRALLRAAVHGDIHILLPLIVSVDEVIRARELLEESAAELRARGTAHRADVPVGVMIETPAAAVAADTMVGEAAFFSIGTNDLVQYTLAVDRGNANLASRFTPLHPAVLRLIQRTVQVGQEHGLDVAVCGEMASQPLMALALIGLGIRTLSVAPRSVPRIKRIVRSLSAAVAHDAISEALRARSAAGAESALRLCLIERMPDAFLLLDDGLPNMDVGATIKG